MKEKLTFYYGSMAGGKTTRIFQTLYVPVAPQLYLTPDK